MNIQRFLSIIGWIIPSTILALIPKCPVCLAAYVAAWTGIGLSLSAATYLRTSLLTLCGGLILFLVARNWMRRRDGNSCQHEKTIRRKAAC